MKYAVLLTLLIVACEGSIGDQTGAGAPDIEGLERPPGSPADPGGGELTPEALTCDEERRGLAEGRSQRLTSQELLSTLRDIFGASVMDAPAVRTAAAVVPNDRPAGFLVGFDHRIVNVEGILNLADAIGAVVEGDPAIQESLLGCDPADLASCEGAVVDVLAPRLYRRDLSNAEREGIAAIQSEERPHSVRFSIAYLIASPDSTQRVEIEGSESGAAVLISANELAVRLAFRLTGKAPDAALRSAADEGRLSTLAEIEREGHRLLETEAARERLRHIVLEWIHLDGVPDPNQHAAAEFGIDPQGLGAEALEELHRFLDYVLFEQRGTFADLLLDKTAFPFTDRLAQIYGVARSDGPTTLVDGRGGLLLRAGTLMSDDVVPSPIARGVRYVEHILCDPPGAIPADAEELATAIAADYPPAEYSERERTEAKTAGPICAACHARRINPIGFSLGDFGPLSLPQTEERVWDATGAVIATHHVDAIVSDVRLRDESVPRIEGGEGLMQALVEGRAARSCLAAEIFTRTRLRVPSASGEDGCVLQGIEDALVNESVIDAYLRSVVNDDAFLRAPFAE